MPANDGRVLSLRRLALVLGLVAALLLTALYAQTTYLFSEPANLREAAGKAADLELPEIPQLTRWPTIDTAAATTIRLFIAPVNAATPAAQPVEPVADSQAEVPISLTAVVVTSDDRRALLEFGSDRKIVPAREGTLAQGWRVVEIEPEQVTLERGATRKVVYFGDVAPGGN